MVRPKRTPALTRTYQNHTLDSTRWRHYTPRDNDIIVSTSYKSGTTWMQHIILELNSPDRETPDLSASPWIDARFGGPIEDVIAQLDAQDHRRCIKTHLPLDALPYYPQVRYIVVTRDPRDVKKEYATQLHMVWPENLLDTPPSVRPPAGYSLRTYRPGDEPRFFQVMELAGWPGWDAETLHPWRERLLPEGWFMAVHDGSGEIVATAMALRDCLEFGHQGGEIGWIACVPGRRGRGLGAVVSAAATARCLAEGYRDVHLYTEDWRLAALNIYLKLGYQPLLYAPDMAERWRVVCAQLGWPFTLEAWRQKSDDAIDV